MNETLANEILPSGLPLGRTISLDGASYQIIGIVKDAQFHSALQGPVPVAYVAYWQNENEVDARMCIRVAGDLAAALPAIHQGALPQGRSDGRSASSSVPFCQALGGPRHAVS